MCDILLFVYRKEETNWTNFFDHKSGQMKMNEKWDSKENDDYDCYCCFFQVLTKGDYVCSVGSFDAMF